MSRVGSLPVVIREGVECVVNGLNVRASGPKGKIEKEFIGDIKISLSEKTIIIEPTTSTKGSKSMWGTARSIINNMIIGVSEGFVQKLEIIGVGYKVAIKHPYINLALGKSHNTKIFIPNLISASMDGNLLSLSSPDKEILGQFTAKIIQQRPPEPYKGKGIRKLGQYVQRKETKKT